ncbi:MAG: (2Fe-2S) ferredoxin domain-containing protein [Pseudobacteriovorax sp.]|nr:(2Fe-2S) ferredoxin domain-containing protein [Pseudobacteriovorax sp.]
MKSSIEILVCRKSSCKKKNSSKIFDLISEEIEAQGLRKKISVKKTGCLKYCSNAPNIKIMPDQIIHSKFKRKQVENLITMLGKDIKSKKSKNSA